MKTIRTLFGSILVFLCVYGYSLQADTTLPGADHAINEPYQNPDYKRWVQVFEGAGREIFDRRHDIVKALHLKPNQTVADIGAGTGLFTRLFAPQVAPHGEVIAVDISAEFIKNILRTSQEQGLTNVKGVVNTQDSVELLPESIDVAFICDTYHHFEHPQAMMRSIHRTLRPGGEVVIIDFRRIPGISDSWIMQHVREGKEGVIKEMQQAGFSVVEAMDFLRSNFILKFAKTVTE